MVSAPNVLTARQREVIWLVGQGRTHKQIAEELNLSQHTVRRHLDNIAERCGLDQVVAANLVFECLTRGYIGLARPPHVAAMWRGARATTHAAPTGQPDAGTDARKAG